ncbi:MAG: hypothetical protein JXA66_00370 [Oligoflexia bacterium]|nr:hypothetical protein [Oligoflexia bacterium]
MKKLFLLLFFVLASCGSGGNSSVLISWTANKESAVNKSGGGYMVYYSQTQGFGVNDAGVQAVDVPYVTGSTSPVSASIDVESGKTWYVRVAAYATYGAGKVYSTASEEASIQP